MRSHRHTQTKYIELDRHKCQACWKCVEVCPNHVMGKVNVLMHRHARIDHAELCKGCKKCVQSCPNEAIRFIYIPPSRERGVEPSLSRELEYPSQMRK